MQGKVVKWKYCHRKENKKRENRRIRIKDEVKFREMIENAKERGFAVKY
jgi:hypothetical protein